MKIKHIEAIPLVRELEQEFLGGTYRITSRNTIVTRVELDNGVIGETFGGDEVQYQMDICTIVNDIFRPLLAGGDVTDVERHFDTMWNKRMDLDQRSIHTLDLAKHCVRMQAIACADNALWDALGKHLKQPVYKLLGGFRNKVPVIAIGGYVMKGKILADLETEIAHYRDDGMGGMKLKVGRHSVEEDIERTRLARKVGGPGFHLCCDANQSWTVDEAMKFASAVRDLNLAWLEEPIQWQDQIEGNARLRTVGIPVCLGQGEISRHGCRDLIVRGAADILNYDATIGPGVTEWRRTSAMAHCFGVQMAHHEEPQIALHLLAGAPNGLCVEIFPNYNRDPMWFDLPIEQPKIADGYMFCPNKPGFGIDLNNDVVNKWRVPVIEGAIGRRLQASL
jgi:L-alanine-DL-glutamate epimerase-like enolase superfamily enzyme